ncbi:SMP-30/gluconolactonase/LRE family protein [Pelagicoccus sp. SDUM812003]|uniref:SMP-30/gluconolactonase/LRE family protein n=1 Tax=Pelagicoccus sp. SDUM812003 TaxID=3041267 RepID=UPI00280CCD98|nr:SMP-30/gluconolactonase/LRE family protein [Pelagicoccus sp. SDUM812003]MDQ8201625.1 SMP-30/gluconolactonase/LRE family protein [Pelagicoccus sp. SDUM812003]
MCQVSCVYHDRAQLGEGVLWSERERKVYWVDIEGHRVCRYDPDTGANESVAVGQQVGAVVEDAQGGLVVGLKDGLYRLDFGTGRLDKMCDPMNGDPENRLNDGKAGPDGRLYIGGMGPDKQQSLYRVERDGRRFEVIENGLTISNGLTWNADATRFYFIDSPQRVIWGYDFDRTAGAISNRRVVVDATGEDCVPDGMTIDQEGKLWVAFWEGWGVRRYDPDTGDRMAEIKLPASRVTTCCFGGENLDTLYVSTASIGFEERDWQREPQAGGLFAVKPGVKGLPPNLFRHD